MKKTIKSIVAVGTGAAMVGATIFGAVAADLSSLPQPFVKNGQMDALIVVGDTAAASDVIGAINIATTLQYEMQQKTTIALPGESSKISAEGFKFEKTGTKLFTGKALSAVDSSVSDVDWDFLAGGNVVDTEGDETEYTESISVGSAAVTFNKPTGDFTKPELFLDLGTTEAYNYTLKMNDPMNLQEVDGSDELIFGDSKIVLAGKEFTFSNKASEMGNTSFVLYAASQGEVLAVGESKTISVNGKSVSVEVVSANTDDSTANVKINGVLKKVSQGSTLNTADLDIRVKTIFTQTVPIASAMVEFSIGSEKYTFTNGTALQLNDEDVDGTLVTIGLSAGKFKQLDLKVIPNELDDFEDADGNQMNYVLKDKAFVDPIFGTFKILYGGVEEGTLDDIELEVVNGGDDLQLTFKAENGYDVPLVIVGANSTNQFVQEVDDGDALFTTTANLTKGDYCILSEAKADEGFTYVVSLDDVDENNGKVQFSVVGGADKSVSYTNDADNDNELLATADDQLDFGDAAFVVSKINETTQTVQLPCKNMIFTRSGANITLNGNFAGNSSDVANGSVSFQEDAFAQDTDFPAGSKITSTVIYKFDTADEEIQIQTPGTFTWKSAEDDDNDYAATGFGTMATYDAENKDNLLIQNPDIAAVHAVFLAPTSAAATSTGATGGSVETVTLQKMTVNAAKLASEVSGSSNLIVVGGPCANSVAASVLGVTPETCTTGFESGKAMVALKDYNGKVAMVVAGMDAADTRLASQVVADFRTYKSQLKGSEVVISGTKLADVKIEAANK